MGEIVPFKHTNYTILKQIKREALREYSLLVKATAGFYYPEWVVLPDKNIRELFEMGIIEL
jgi:hypothetical protein